MSTARSNLWPFTKRRSAAKAKPARRSTMTLASAITKARAAGKESGDTGLFGQWLEGAGLTDRSKTVRDRLKREYEAGFESKFTPIRHEKLTTHKGHNIETIGQELYVPSIDRDSRFDSVADARKFIDQWTKKNPTDRALRYRANAAPPAGPKVCLFCRSKRNVEVGHLNGHEEDGAPDNLIWTCRSCNVIAGNTLKSAKLGRLTRQYNPTKSGGAANIGEWTNAVGAIVPHKGAKYAGSNYGIVSTMSVGDAVAMIRATPDHKRREFAGKIRTTKRGRARTADERWNPEDPQDLIRMAQTSRNILELARLHKWARLRGNQTLLSAVETRAKKLGISHKDLLKNEPGKAWNPKHKRNPQSEADALYESFHGRPSTETVLIEETVHEHRHLATLGKLVEVWIETPSGLLAHLEFDGDDAPFLASSENGRQLYIEGGDQEIDLKTLKMDGDEWVKDRMVLGTFARPEPRDKGKGRRKHNLTYHTEKEFDNFEPVDYQHDLGEETGVRPTLEYEPRNQHLFVAGGQYRIERPLFGTSPGIEN